MDFLNLKTLSSLPMKKLKLHSKDLTAENIQKLAELFPNCLTETRDEETGEVRDGIDFDLLRQELSADLVEGPQERYRLDWPGKREALATANAPIAKTLRPCREESVDFESTENLYIEGDNLDALKLLQETYLGKVKMIYIDPPYNTGNDFIYDDNYSMTREDYRDLSGEVDEDGNQMFDEEKWQENSSARGRYHSEWLSMIFPRVRLARNLLSDLGVVLISINDGESSNLKRLCDGVFGEQNFVAQMVWDGGRKNDSRFISESHDYILLYAKNVESLKEQDAKWKEKKPGVNSVLRRAKSIWKNSGADEALATKNLRSWFESLPAGSDESAHRHYKMLDEKGPWYGDNISSPNPRPNLTFEYKGYEPPDNGWRYNREAMEKLDGEGLLYFPGEKTSRIQFKRYLSSTTAQTPKSVFYTDRRASSKRLDKLFGLRAFDFPKDEDVIANLISIATRSKDIILDFFSGSATTAHAVMKLNSEDGGTRRHIQVQLSEPCDEKSAAFKAGYATIAEIGKERIRRAGAKIREELTAQLEDELPGSEKHTEITAKLANLDTGFRVLKIDSSNMTGDYYKRPDQTTQDGLDLAVENIKANRSPEDLLFQVMLDWGVDLALPITKKTIAGKEVFFVAPGGDDPESGESNGNAALAACFELNLDDDFSKALAKKLPLRAVFRDASFKDDAARINVEQLFKTISPTTDVRAI